MSRLARLIFAFACLLLTHASLPAADNSTGDCIAIEFMAENNSDCAQMHRVTDLAIQDGWVVRRIDTKREPHVALRWSITTVPTTVLVRNGREVDRILGPVQYTELQKRLKAASSIDSMRNSTDRHKDRVDSSAPVIRGQSNMNLVPTVASSNFNNSVAFNGSASATLDSQAFDSRPSMPRDPPSLGKASQTPSLRSDPQAATVRIRVEEAELEAVGTGTIIDSYNGEALVLTCGHLFRDCKPQSKITVETFLNGQAQTYPAQIIDFVANGMDIGLIAFRAGGPVPVARLIPKNRKLTEGQSVFSWGCDRGALPSRRDSRITKLNRYLGPANVEVDGEPVEGRSGGGLFDDRGELIGVCYAADPQLKEGLYSAADVVYFELAKLNLQRLFNDRNDEQLTQAVSPSLARSNAPAPNNSRSVPEMTVIIRASDGTQEKLVIPQPAPHLLQALRESAK